MYAKDTFFHLSQGGQIGLACLSLVLFGAMLILCRRLTRHKTRVLDLAIALGLFWLFMWLSPQIYYQYFRMIIDGLPAQWVIWPVRGPSEAIALLTLRGPNSLSAHGQAILGWSMLILSQFGNNMFRRNAAN